MGGRRQLNSATWYSHDAEMRNHRKIKSLRKKFDHGYEIWCMLLEVLTKSDGNVWEYSDLELEMLEGDFNREIQEIRGVIDYCISIELLFRLPDGFIYSESHQERLEPLFAKRQKSREQSSKQIRLNGKFTKALPEHTQADLTPGMEITPKIQLPPPPPDPPKPPTKKRIPKVFIAPTLKEVKDYFDENSQPLDQAERAWKHYTLADPPWHDTNGKPVVNWKQKMHTNWFDRQSIKNSNKPSPDEPTRNLKEA